MSNNVPVSFVATSILRTHEFSWVFLVDWIMIIFLAIFSIFYFNQLLGILITHTVGWWLWHRYEVYFKVQSIQISLLGGRIMFHNVVYIGTSQAFRAVQGNLSWRYWLPHRQRSAILNKDTKGFNALKLKLAGLEWFVYNREYAYDGMARQEPASAELAREFNSLEKSLSYLEHKVAELLPLQLSAQQVAVVIGNDDTNSLVIANAPHVDGLVDMRRASNPLDRYGIAITMNFTLPEVALHDNPDFQDTFIKLDQPKESRSKRKHLRDRLRLKSKREPQKPWFGLKLYMDEANGDEPGKAFHTFPSQPQSPGRKTSGQREASNDEKFPDELSPGEMRSRLGALPAEYAKVSEILNCDELKLDMYMDIAGSEPEEFSKHDADPLFTVAIDILNGKITYGPWAERQRQNLWATFFPQNLRNTVLPEFPVPGDLRMYRKSDVSVCFEGETFLVVPVREHSQDDTFVANFAKNLGLFGDEIQRNYGWLEFRADSETSVTIELPFLPSTDGYHTKVLVDLKKPEVRSSVNHDTMLTVSSHCMEIIQHVPLEWNALQTFEVNMKSTDVEFFVLREHLTLISDAAIDFAAGPPVPYALFTPSTYLIKWDLERVGLFFNVNKGNIINKPTSLNENTFLIFRAPNLDVSGEVPRDQITTPMTFVKTSLKAPVVDVELSTPDWHTLQSFLDSKRMAHITDFSLTWSDYLSTLTTAERELDTSVDTNDSRFVDTQVLLISGKQFAMIAHGFLIEYIMRIRENYFGHAYHFQTTEEYLHKQEQVITEETYEFSRSDLDNDTQIRVVADKGCFILPTHLYSARDCVTLQFLQLNMDCRFTNYYMDLQAELSPVTGRLLRGLNPETVLVEAMLASPGLAELSISHIDVHAHRMFGLPPSEPTYLVQWDFDVGDITTDSGLEFWLAMHQFGSAFGHSFDDDENKPVMPPDYVPDIVFVSANISSVMVKVRTPTEKSSRLEVSIGTIKFRLNDLATEHYSAHNSLNIATVSVRGYLDDELALEARTAAYVTGFTNKKHANAEREAQQEHLALHDALFHRAPFLLDSYRKDRAPFKREKKQDDIRPCIPLSHFPPPLTREMMALLPEHLASFGEPEWYDTMSEDASLASLADDSPESSARTSFSSDSGSIPYFSRPRDAYDPDVFPFSASTVSPEREKLKSTRPVIQLRQKPWRQDAPSLNVETDEFETSSRVVQIANTTISLTPRAVVLAAKFDVTAASENLEAQLDMLQILVVKALLAEDSTLIAMKAHIILPRLTAHFSEQLDSAHGIELNINDADMMFGVTGDHKGAHSSFKTMSLSLRQGGSDFTELAKLNAISIVLSELTCWWQQTSTEESTGSLQLAGLDVSVADDQTEWATHYLAHLAFTVIESANKSRGPPRQNQRQIMFYALTIAGENMGLEQDAYVLSRTSGAVQSQSHIRTKISWRILMRLRYILQRLPPTQVAQLQDEINQGKYLLPPDALKQSIGVYRNWRSWEQAEVNLADTELFRQVFDVHSFQDYVLSLSLRFIVRIESMMIRIVHRDRHEHYVGIDSLLSHFVSTKMNETQNLSLTLQSEKIRTRGSIELIHTAAVIMKSLDEAKAQYEEASTQSFSTQEKQESQNAHEDEGMALQASISLFVLDLVMEFDLGTVNIETQNHQVQFTSGIELMQADHVDSLFHSGTLVTSNGAFRIYETEDGKDVLDTLVKSLHVGYASRGPASGSSTWATVNADTISLAIHPTATELASLIVDFLERELPRIKKVANELEEATPHKAGSFQSYPSDISIASQDFLAAQPLAGKFVNVNVQSMKLRARLVDDLKLVLQGRQLAIKLRHSDSLVSSFDLDRGTIGVHYGGERAAFANAQLEGARSIMRYDFQLAALAIFTTASALRLETMSLVWLMEYATHKHLDAQIAELSESLNRCFEILNNNASSESTPSVGRQQSESIHSENSSKLKLRLVNRLREISVVLPLDSSSFKLSVEDARVHFENFETFEELEQLERVPRTVSASIADLKLILRRPEKPPREMMRLQLSLSTRQEDNKDLVNVESERTSFGTDPEAIGALYIAIEKLKQNSRTLFSRRQATVTQPASKPSRFRLDDLERLRVHLLLQALTVTWYTDPSSQDGIVFGYEKLQIRMAKLFAHLDLTGTYVTPVSQSKLSIAERPNTLYLPLVEARAFIVRNNDAKASVEIEVFGKSVNVAITPSAASWILRLLDSVSSTTTMLDGLARTSEVPQSSDATAPPLIDQVSNESGNKFQWPFDLRFYTHFERSALRLLEENSRTKDPALQLFSPAVDINGAFHDTHVRVQVDISSTSNEVFPKAISEVKAFTSLIALHFKTKSAKSQHEMKSSSPPPPPLSSIAASQQGSFKIKGLDLDIKVHLGSQELYVSCLPFGKVGALISTKGADIIVLTSKAPKLDDTYLTIQGFLREARISLQHMYSREVSTMAEFSQLTALGMYRPSEPFKLAVNLHRPLFQVKLTKLPDMRIFFDIWSLYGNSADSALPVTVEPEPEPTKLRRRFSTASSTSRPQVKFALDDKQDTGSSNEEDDEYLLDKYLNAVSSIPFAWTVNISVTDVLATVSMGPSIGESQIKIDRLWIADLKTTMASQTLNGGVDSVSVNFEGRLGGALKLNRLIVKAAVSWGQGSTYPLLHGKVRLGYIGGYLSLDFHPFLAGEVQELAAFVTTQDQASVSDDRINVAGSCGSISLVFTALLAAHLIDLIMLFKRLQSQLSSTPTFLMPEVSQEAAANADRKRKTRRARLIERHGNRAGMRVLYDIKIGELLVHVFPTDFADNVALKVMVERVEVHFDSRKLPTEVQCEIDLALDSCVVGLSNIKGGGYRESMTDLDYAAFLLFVRKSASGGTIVNTPELTLLMDTWEPHGKNVVYYVFSNQFLGSVDVGWNLGSVNFIKEMVKAHKEALAVRQNVNELSNKTDAEPRSPQNAQAYREAKATIERTASLSSKPSVRSLSNAETDSTESTPQSPVATEPTSPAKKMPSALATTGEDSELFYGYRYISKQPPVIVIPQLRDLGDATPPIEWLGVNRERLPLFVHHFLTRKLEHAANDLEKLYREMIGRIE